MQKTVIALITFGVLGCHTQADTILTTGFDGHTGVPVLAGNTDNATGSATAGITDWTIDASVTSISDVTAISPGAGFVQLQGGTATYAGPDNLYVNNNHNSGDASRGFSLTFDINKIWQLTNLNVLSGHSNNAGNQDQAYVSTLNFSLSGGTLGAAVTGASVEDYGVAPDYHSVDFDLTGATIGPGTYTLEVSQDTFVGGGAYAIYDGITLEAIPEPATALLLGLGVMMLIARRRR